MSKGRSFALRVALYGVAGLVLVTLLARNACAAVPDAGKVSRAVAEANGVSGRGVPLLIEVELRVEGGAATAEGELAVHPSGLARLELRNRWGFVERHLLQGSAYQASRDGELLSDPHPFLPPVFLLQARSGEALSAALESFGIDARVLVLGKLGAHDCYVFGGRAIGAPEAALPRPSLWVDIESYDPLLVVGADGSEHRFGPIGVFDGIRLPRWIELRGVSGFRARLDVKGAARAEAPAALFQPRWLTDPPAAP